MTVYVDSGKVGAIMREAARVEILPRFQNVSTKIWEKTPGAIVTEADVAAEKMLTRDLTALLPGTVVGEESTAADPSLFAALGRDPVVWIIDPVDGTRNFTKGKERFAVIVALMVNGKTVGGWILDPITDRLVHAQQGQGAWLNETPLRVPADLPIERMKGSAHYQSLLANRVAHAGRGGSTGHDYIDLATGDLDFAYFNRLFPWDHAAGILIHREAGGYNSHVDGTLYRPIKVDTNPVIAAPAPASWEALKDVAEGVVM